MTKVKICGITDKETAIACIESGADFLGFNFVPNSKRYISHEAAFKIIIQLRELSKRISLVGVFQNQDANFVNKLAKILKLDFVQLHGNEDQNYMKNIKYSIIKSIKISDFKNKLEITKIGRVSFLLVDREVQGTGDIVDINEARKLSKKFNIFFAGGLTPENVAKAIKEIKPFAVDVASGVETNGRKDQQKIKIFIQQAKLGGNL